MSQSEDGFERNRQSTTLTLEWPLEGQGAEIEVPLEVQSDRRARFAPRTIARDRNCVRQSS